MSLDFKYNYPQIARDSGFKLRQFRDGPLDWRLVGSLEVERILREQQFEHIDAILFYLSEAPLASMLESNILDSGIAKYFILSQLAIQYLIFCRKFLGETVKTLRESLIEAEIENVKLKSANQDHSNEIVQLHKKISQIEAISDIVFPCHICTKNFVSNDALNVHLSKKHTRSPTGDIQCKDNDLTLINTIKLELEIKQLKERLNIAEKDIRETAESKKASPREVTKICSSTQINTITNDVGTQSNLPETKESDCNMHVEINKLESLSQLQEKISKLETWQETQHSDNQQLINDITEKLSEIKNSIQSRSEYDVESLKKLTNDAISSTISLKRILPATFTDELQTILCNTISEVMHFNSEKLNKILTKIETIYDEKLPFLEIEIQKRSILAKDRSNEAISSPMATTFLSKMEKRPYEEKESITPSSRRTYSIEKPNLVGFSNERCADGSSTDISEEMSESQENDFEVHNSTKPETISLIANNTETIRSLEKKMTSYGINSDAKTISASEAAIISANLAENRDSLKKAYPQFYATRNKLKKLVYGLSSQKQLNNQAQGAFVNKIAKLKSEKNYLEKYSKRKETSSYTELSPSKNQFEKNDAFKKRLEKILSSPIKKPTTFVPNRTKPIPMPRKRVMFYNPDDESTGEEVSLTKTKPALGEDPKECT